MLPSRTSGLELRAAQVGVRNQHIFLEAIKLTTHLKVKYALVSGKEKRNHN